MPFKAYKLSGFFKRALNVFSFPQSEASGGVSWFKGKYPSETCWLRLQTSLPQVPQQVKKK